MANEPRWYYPSGEPCSSVPGRKADRKPTIRDARALGLLPSVTTLLSIVRKPGLEAWMLRSNEAEAEERRSTAAELGVAIHGGIAARIATWPLVAADELLVHPTVTAWAEWMQRQDYMPYAWEKGLALPAEKYAGTPDLIAIDRETEDVVVIDWKTQATRDKSISFWDEWPVQLAAYGHMAVTVGQETIRQPTMPRLISVVLSTDEPGIVVAHEWRRDRCNRYLSAFYAARDLWYSELGPGSGLTRDEEIEEEDDD